MAAPFSSSDEAIINTIVPLSQLTLSSTSRARGIDVETLYDVRRVATLIRAHGFRRIALQFPDELLGDASQVFWALEDALSSGPFVQDGAPQLASPAPELYILADTSYGNCCVDEVAAEHVDADLVVHFGHACLSPCVSTNYALLLITGILIRFATLLSSEHLACPPSTSFTGCISMCTTAAPPLSRLWTISLLRTSRLC